MAGRGQRGGRKGVERREKGIGWREVGRQQTSRTVEASPLPWNPLRAVIGGAGGAPGADGSAEPTLRVSKRQSQVLTASMLSARPRSRRRVAHSSPPSPTSSEDEQPLSSSTYSLLSPIYHQSFQSCNEEEKEDREEAALSARGQRTFKRNKHNSNAESCNVTEKKKQSPLTDNLSPWEEWFICKERELRVRLQARALEEMNLQVERRKEKQELERKKRIAEEKHKEWVLKKNEEERKEKERKLIKKMAEKAARDLERIQLQEKAKGKYKEWLKKKRAEESEKKKKEEEKEQKRVAELQEKKEKSEKIFREWLQNARNKPRPVLHGYGYTNGKLPGYSKGNSYPAPAYCNPIPWKPIHVPPPKEDRNVTVKKNKRPISSQSYRSSAMVIHKPKNNLCIGSLHRKQR
ncbi:coiled-coil domain-containing protein 34 isoform X1 [Malaclemys terrapin pileata]|uniref:coiled-coil domain-containing protein 34 isoform X1 n=1 Tax=Malaclemys terrapin pileata TaxID=2991368 RepID=UPI0023A88502|nr:coiled-coil domain-containing protein 34 isoform X1 [Malaclemys terrapin pileata]